MLCFQDLYEMSSSRMYNNKWCAKIVSHSVLIGTDASSSPPTFLTCVQLVKFNIIKLKLKLNSMV
jgi:hypothetical protein